MSRPPSPDRLRQLGYPIAEDGSMRLPPSPRCPLGRATLDEQFSRLWRLTAHQRVAAMYRGELSDPQLCKWAARYPDEIAVVNDEFVFIAIGLPEVAASSPSDQAEKGRIPERSRWRG